jgi:hypothetical protein
VGFWRADIDAVGGGGKEGRGTRGEVKLTVLLPDHLPKGVWDPENRTT